MKKSILFLIIILFLNTVLGAEEVSQVAASSFLYDESDICRYHVLKMFDDDPKTAWIEGKSESGIGETIVLHFEEPIKSDTIKILPGYFDSKLYKKNNRIKKLSIKINKSTKPFTTVLSDGMTIDQINLAGSPFINNIEIKIIDIYKGSAFDNTCISELAFYYRERKVNLDFSTAWEYQGYLNAQELTGISSPSGFKIVEYGMFGATNEFFFPDGIYVHTYSHSPGGIFGNWRMINNGKSVEIYNLNQKYLEGTGESIDENKIVSYYEDYIVIELPVINRTIAWPVDFQEILLYGWNMSSFESILASEYQSAIITDKDFSDEIKVRKQKYLDLKKLKQDER